jgi:hypothetical protein
LGKKKIFLGPHINQHRDEELAGWEAVRFGEKLFPGISKAEVIYLEAGMQMAIEAKDTNIIPLGTGKLEFDEHTNDFSGTDRIPNECSATLMAKELGIDGDPRLKELLQYVLLDDTRGVHSPLDLVDFHIASIAQHEQNPAKVTNIFRQIFDALYEHQEELAKVQRDRVADFIEKWLQEKGEKDQRVVDPIVKFVRGLRNGNKKPFDLTKIFCALEKKFGSEAAEAIAKELLEAKYFVQRQFFDAEKELHEKVQRGEAKVIPVVRSQIVLNVVVIQSDNPQISKVCRHREYGYNAAIVIQKNSKGNCFIFTNNIFYIRDDMKRIAAGVRREEMLLCVRSGELSLGKQRMSLKMIDSFEEMSRAGSIGEMPIWYFQQEDNNGGGKLLNGSKSTGDVEPTKISLQELGEIIVSVLKLGRNFQWDVWREIQWNM